MLSPIAVLRNDGDVSECWGADFYSVWHICSVTFNVVEEFASWCFNTVYCFAYRYRAGCVNSDRVLMASDRLRIR